MKKRIYLVEDNDDIRELIEFLLTEEKYEVHAHATVSSFKNELKAAKPDMIVMDIMLPDGNGVDVCAGLKADKATMDVPILMMSANANGDLVKRQCHAEDFINKPFDIGDFVSRIYKYA